MPNLRPAPLRPKGRHSKPLPFRYVLAVAALAYASSVPEALACGGGGVTTSVDTSVGIEVQRVFLSVRNDKTEVVTQITVPSTADYGVLLPLPAEPVLDPNPVSNADLNTLDDATAPAIRVESGGEDDDESCGCPLVMGSDSAAGGVGTSIHVSRPVDIGPVTAVVLSGDSDDAIRSWLEDNGFAIPETHTSVFEAYAGLGQYFVALRRNGTAAAGPSSVGVHFTVPGDRRTIPLQFASIGAGPTVAFRVIVAAPEVVGPAAPFTALTLDDLDPTLLGAEDYEGAIEKAVADHEYRAFVIESTHERSELVGVAPSLLALMGTGAHVTRLTTILPGEALTDDATLNMPVTKPIPNFRILTALPRGVRAAGAGVFLTGLLFARRRRRLGREVRKEPHDPARPSSR